MPDTPTQAAQRRINRAEALEALRQALLRLGRRHSSHTYSRPSGVRLADATLRSLARYGLAERVLLRRPDGSVRGVEWRAIA